MKSMEIKRIIVNSGSNTTLVTESMEIAYSSVFLKVIINTCVFTIQFLYLHSSVIDFHFTLYFVIILFYWNGI